MDQSPSRSFNIDKLLKTHGKNTDGVLLSGENNTEIDFGTSEGLSFGANFGIEYWFVTPGHFNDGKVFLIEAQDQIDNNFNLTLESGLNLFVNTGSFGAINVIEYGPLNPNQKYCLAFTGYQGVLSMYVNGVFVDEANIGVTTFWSIYGDTSLKIRTEGIDCLVEKFYLWNRPAFASSILEAYNRGAGVYPPAYSRGYWNFYNREANTVIDTSQHGNFGTIKYGDKTNYSTKTSPAWKQTPNSEPYINNTTFPEFAKSMNGSALSAEGWIYIDADGDTLAQTPYLIRIVNDGNIDNPYEMLVGTTRRLNNKLTYTNSAGNHNTLEKIPFKQWVHVGFSVDLNENDINSSINGKVQNNWYGVTVDFTFDFSNVSGLVFGDSRAYNIMFRNWRLYSVQLTDEELIKAYKYTTEYPVSREYVIGEWKFQEESTGWAYDCSDHGNYLFPSTISGIGSTPQLLAEYVEESGFYPEMWDGYSYATVATDIYGDHIVNVSYPEFIIGRNTVLECLYFDAYKDLRRGFDFGYSGEETSTYPIAIGYGPYIRLTKETEQTLGYYFVENSVGTRYNPTIPVREIPDPSLPRKVGTKDGKWHHIIAVQSAVETISGTDYNYAIYDNGKLAGITSYSTITGIDTRMTGGIFFGHYLNGAMAIGRIYNPTDEGIKPWLSGENVLFSPGFSVSDCDFSSAEGSNLLFDANLDYDNQQVSNKVSSIPVTYELQSSVNFDMGTAVSKIPLNHRYFSVADTVPEVPTPKFAITDIEHDNEYSLEATFRINYNSTESEFDVIASDPINFIVRSGLYIATVTPSITVSGIFYFNRWHHIAFRYKDDVASLIYSGDEIYSGISNDWYSPQETIKWGFYANPPVYHDAVEVKRIAAYDQWLSEASIAQNNKNIGTVAHYPLKQDFQNYRANQPFD